MRFSEYLAGMPEAAQRTLTDDLTLGCGRVALAIRLHRQDPSTAAMLGMLATAHASLRDALEALDPEAGLTAGRPARAHPEDALPARWEALVAGADPEAVEAWLGIAAQMARDTAASTVADLEVATLRELLQGLLRALATVRDDTLGAG